MNINIELFKRYKPDKKVQIIMELTEEELLAITPATVTRIIKEAGTRLYRSRDKRLWIPDQFRTGNHWNSTFNGVELIKGKLYVSLYVQYSNTDTDPTPPTTSFSQEEIIEGLSDTTISTGILIRTTTPIHRATRQGHSDPCCSPMFNVNTGTIMKRKKKTLAERKRQERHTTADKPANPSFHNFTVRRTIEIHLTTINPQLTQRDAEFYVDGNFYVRGQLDGKYQDFYLTRVKMNYNNRKNSTDNGKDEE